MSGFRVKNPSSIGVAFLGVGRIGTSHLRTLAGIGNARIVVVADLDPSEAERGREIGRAERATADALDAIGDPAVEAVVIATPTSTHAGLIEAALRAGKAIWSEKPIALDLAETTRVVELWRETGLPVQMGFMRRFDPGYVRAKELIESGELGRVEQFRAYSRDTYPPPPKFIRDSGGSFLDMSVHDFDLARFLVGEVEEVSAWGSNIIDKRFEEGGDVDTAVTMLRFRNGALGVVEMSRRSAWGYDIRTEVAGALGQGRRRGRPQDAADLVASVRLRGRSLRELPRSVRGRLPARVRGVLPNPGRRRHADARARGGPRDAPTRPRRQAELAGRAAGPGRRGRGRGGSMSPAVTRHLRPRGSLGTHPRDHAGEHRLAIPVVPGASPWDPARRSMPTRVRPRSRWSRSAVPARSRSGARRTRSPAGTCSARSRTSSTCRRDRRLRSAPRRRSRSRSGRLRPSVVIPPACTCRASCRASSAAAPT